MSCLLESKGILIPFLEFESVQSIVMKHLTTCFTTLTGKVSFITQLGLEKRNLFPGGRCLRRQTVKLVEVSFNVLLSYTSEGKQCKNVSKCKKKSTLVKIYT